MKEKYVMLKNIDLGRNSLMLEILKQSWNKGLSSYQIVFTANVLQEANSHYSGVAPA